MKNKKVLLTISLLLIIGLTCIISVFAHSGRTDANGGHRDNTNQSGLGSYHYHCGGHPAHLHTNGVCPYKSSSSSANSSTTNHTSTSDRYDEGYDDGYSDRYNDGCDAGFVDGRTEGYNEGYDKGYEEGSNGGYYEGYDKGFADGYDKQTVTIGIATLLFILAVIVFIKVVKSKRHRKE